MWKWRYRNKKNNSEVLCFEFGEWNEWRKRKQDFEIFLNQEFFLWLARARRVSFKGKTTTFSRGRCSRVGPVVFWSLSRLSHGWGPLLSIMNYRCALGFTFKISVTFFFLNECKILLSQSTWQNLVVSGSILICGVGPLHYGTTVLCFRAFLLLVVFVSPFKKKENDTYYK